MERQSILDTAQQLVSNDRNSVYGHPRDNFGTTAEMWNAYIKRREASHKAQSENPFALTALDVAHMMALVKLARLANTPDHPDSIVDVVGYELTADKVING